MAITKLLPVLLKHKDAILEDGLDPRAHAQRQANNGISYGKKVAAAPLRAWESIPRMVVRGLQFLLGIVIVGIYGNRVSNGLSPEWLYGLVVAGVSSVTAVVFAIAAPFGAVSNRCKTHRLFTWDLMIFILWIVAFGIFAGIFLHRDSDDSYKGSSTTVEKAAMWIDLVNAVLWLISGVYGFAKTFLGGKIDTLGGKVTGKLFRDGEKEKAHQNMGRYETV
ncbi:hypothetical protein VSDG_01379 [Cytospora chrysosperma]|uniref:MARVEL domain-containing protein n=1 Tax=Cytospora chrysosperma TaxID=252740 RepID=A0A423WJK3_CYTCH|nr:hypothetical protein VSDG_01379 [Valsa sordida]